MSPPTYPSECTALRTGPQGQRVWGGGTCVQVFAAGGELEPLEDEGMVLGSFFSVHRKQAVGR